ncbi:MAG: superoxide dismutase family protein, partial [Chitinophagaceae bacterium]
MKKTILSLSNQAFFLCLLSGSLLAACNNAGNEKKEEPPAEEVAAATADITGTKSDTTVNGTASFTKEGDGKVKLDLTLSVPAMANRSVAVHFHEHGDCGNSGNDSHGHWNPTHKQHGKWGTGEFHSGDIGNITLDSAGKATFSLDTDLWTLGGDSTTNILDRAVIVHSGVDDYTTQPT